MNRKIYKYMHLIGEVKKAMKIDWMEGYANDDTSCVNVALSKKIRKMSRFTYLDTQSAFTVAIPYSV